MKSFKDFPEFQPNITPQQMFSMGIMGGSYFRTIKSPHTNKVYNRQNRYQFLKNLDKSLYANTYYDKEINYYKVLVGTSYEFWMSKNWIREDIDPYGWIEWYINFYNGRRTEDDKRQVKRWLRIAGPNGRFRKQLQNKITKEGINDPNLYKGMRQTLLHWGFDTRKMKP